MLRARAILARYGGDAVSVVDHGVSAKRSKGITYQVRFGETRDQILLPVLLRDSKLQFYQMTF